MWSNRGTWLRTLRRCLEICCSPNQSTTVQRSFRHPTSSARRFSSRYTEKHMPTSASLKYEIHILKEHISQNKTFTNTFSVTSCKASLKSGIVVKSPILTLMLHLGHAFSLQQSRWQVFAPVAKDETGSVFGERLNRKQLASLHPNFSRYLWRCSKWPTKVLPPTYSVSTYCILPTK